jgi:hypothetical protein
MQVEPAEGTAAEGRQRLVRAVEVEKKEFLLWLLFVGDDCVKVVQKITSEI